MKVTGSRASILLCCCVAVGAQAPTIVKRRGPVFLSVEAAAPGTRLGWITLPGPRTPEVGVRQLALVERGSAEDRANYRAAVIDVQSGERVSVGQLPSGEAVRACSGTGGDGSFDWIHCGRGDDGHFVVSEVTFGDFKERARLQTPVVGASFFSIAPERDADSLVRWHIGIPSGGVPPAGLITSWAPGAKSVAWTFQSPANDQLGFAVCALTTTVDAVPCSALVVSAPRTAGGANGEVRDAGAIVCFRAADGHELWRIAGSTSAAQFGRSVCSVPDINGDGFEDVAVGSPFSNASEPFAGQVAMYSGKSRELLWAVDGRGKNEQLGVTCKCVPDLDGDGIEDLAVGAMAIAPAPGGAIRFLSGANGHGLLTMACAIEHGQVGTVEALSVDLNHDSVADLVVCAPGSEITKTVIAKTWVVDGAAIREQVRAARDKPESTLALD